MSNVNLQVLKEIVAASKINQLYFVTQADGQPLADAGLIQVDTSNIQDGKAASRATEAGIKMVDSENTMNGSDASKYQIMTNVPLPKSKRGNRTGGGAPTQYPFDRLEVGNTFFVAATEKMPDPVKGLASTISAKNMKYSEPTGEYKTKKLPVRNGKQIVKDGNGNTVMEDRQIAVRKQLRKFSVRPVTKGEKLGDWIAPDNGAIVARVL